MRHFEPFSAANPIQGTKNARICRLSHPPSSICACSKCSKMLEFSPPPYFFRAQDTLFSRTPDSSLRSCHKNQTEAPCLPATPGRHAATLAHAPHKKGTKKLDLAQKFCHFIYGRRAAVLNVMGGPTSPLGSLPPLQLLFSLRCFPLNENKRPFNGKM